MTFTGRFCTLSKGLGRKISNKDALSPKCFLAHGAKAVLKIKHVKQAEQKSFLLSTAGVTVSSPM